MNKEACVTLLGSELTTTVKFLWPEGINRAQEEELLQHAGRLAMILGSHYHASGMVVLGLNELPASESA